MTNFFTSVLASGSKGNATLVSTVEQHFLIDIGISCRELTRRLRQCHLEPQQLTAVFITHEHSDHIKGLATFLKKYSVPVYTSAPTWKAIYLRSGALNRENCFTFPGVLELGQAKITSFALSHDAVDPHGYTIEQLSTGSRFTYLTDTGFITDTVREAAEGCEVLVLESNHDIDMLKKGSYPYELKQRILSTQGHLSNTAAGYLLSQLQQLPEDVFLAHLSEQNNTPALALQTVSRKLEALGKLQTTKLHVASQHNIISNIAVEEALF